MGDEAIQTAHRYALEAERKMGQLCKAEAAAGRLATRERNVGRPPSKGVPAGDTFPATTAEVGLTRKSRNEAEKMLGVYAPVKEAAKERQREGGREKVTQQIGEAKHDRETDSLRAKTAGRGRPKKEADSSVVQIPPSGATDDRETRTIRAKAAGTNPKYIDLAEKMLGVYAPVKAAAKERQREGGREKVRQQIAEAPDEKGPRGGSQINSSK